jgi:hypothetical protein
MNESAWIQIRHLQFLPSVNSIASHGKDDCQIIILKNTLNMPKELAMSDVNQGPYDSTRMLFSPKDIFALPGKYPWKQTPEAHWSDSSRTISLLPIDKASIKFLFYFS